MIKSVVGILEKDNKILMLKRHFYDRTLPNVYCLPGGKVEEKESLESALKREVYEETGLNVCSQTYLEALDVEIKEKHFEINMFSIETHNQEVLISDEHSEYKWFSRAEVETENVAENTKKFLLEKYFQPSGKA